uniref:stabilizer of axonemal microtubules 2-like n=1 Tax=Myxine glutinosa TaxID=7769 RepID=UPI00358F8326
MMKCLCNICTCGRHRCSDKPTFIHEGTEKPVKKSEYLEKFPCHIWTKPPSPIKPKQEYKRNEGRMEGITTTRLNFVPHKLQPRLARVPEVYKAPEGKQNGLSTYVTDFQQNSTQPIPLPLRQKEQLQLSSEKMTVVPTYTDEFKQWPISKIKSMKPECRHVPPSSRFGHRTTNQIDYTSKEGAPRQSCRPGPDNKLYDGDFDGQTVHNMTFVTKMVEPWPRHVPEPYTQSSKPLDDLTVHRRDFMGKAGEPVQSCKPKTEIADTSAPFEGLSEMKEKFPTWSVCKREVPQTKPYEPPTGDMDLTTTTQLMFRPFEAQRPTPGKPHLSTIEISKGPFEGQSTSSEDYRQWQVSRREPVRKPQAIQPPVGNMENLTTFRQHFVPHSPLATQNFKPPNVAIQSNIPFDGTTHYKNEFTAKHNDVCPAMYSVPRGYVYDSEDPRGHSMYRSVSNSVAENNHLPSDIICDNREVSVAAT